MGWLGDSIFRVPKREKRASELGSDWEKQTCAYSRARCPRALFELESDFGVLFVGGYYVCLS